VLRVLQFQDISAEVAAVKANLTRVVEEGGDSDHGTPTPTPSPAPTPVPAGCEEVETALMELVKAEKWASALRHARHNRFGGIMLLFSVDVNLFSFVTLFLLLDIFINA